MSAAENPVPRILTTARTEDSRGLVLKHVANELVFAVVGHVGSGTSEIADSLKDILADENLQGGKFDAHIIKASAIIKDWADSNGFVVPQRASGLNYTTKLQDLGDKMRAPPKDEGGNDIGPADYSAVARRLILKIRESRAASQDKQITDSEPVLPNGERRAYILDSLRHPAEVNLLRHLYQDAFVLIGVACEENARMARLRGKFPHAGNADLTEFMKRDADDTQQKHGQKVADTFHLSDFFVDNTTDRVLEHDAANPAWDTPEKLGRLVKIVTHSGNRPGPKCLRPRYAPCARGHDAKCVPVAPGRRGPRR